MKTKRRQESRSIVHLLFLALLFLALVQANVLVLLDSPCRSSSLALFIFVVVDSLAGLVVRHDAQCAAELLDGKPDAALYPLEKLQSLFESLSGRS